ncbi:MAG: N-6 DNA methylase [Bacilli bacterium]|jgi:type I restriction-modification system DNA methylase subunit/predicted type IV restriction endonuclease
MTHNSTTRSTARSAIERLVSEFKKGEANFKDPRKYDEAKVRAGFIDPFFEAFGWSVKEGQRRFGKDREVIVEDRAGRGNRRRPDYGFYLLGELKFYVEAKAPSHNLKTDLDAIYQLKSYVWSKRAPVGLLTDFEELITFHGAFRPQHDKAFKGRISRFSMTYDQYLDNFDLLHDAFSHEAVASGSIERVVAEELAASVRQRDQLERDLFKARGASAVDSDFLQSLTTWREEVAKELARRNDFKDGYELTEAVQRFLDRLIFARIAEDRGIERTETIEKATNKWERDDKKKPLYTYLISLFKRLAISFNGGLFAPHPLSDEAEFLDDKILQSIVRGLYFPECPYRFDAMPVEMLGSIYERFLGSVVRVTESGRRAKVELKPEFSHAHGVYYTPLHIVDTIVERTLEPLLENANPDKAMQIRILDPACGSGSFLLGAFQYLIDWHLRYYTRSADSEKKHKKFYYVDENGNSRLTLQRKREILTNCLYGVDKDAQAVEVAQMSLYLKLMEEEAEETIAYQRSLEMFKAERYLPDLSRNIRWGNSLIEAQDLDPQFDWAGDELEINPFDWQAQSTGFGDIVSSRENGGRGGFDAIIGNPPYIRVQALKKFAKPVVELYKRKYLTARKGNYDIYVAFIERGLQLLKTGGRLGFIVPSKWWQATYGDGLRKVLKKGRHLRTVLDFAHEQVFEGPTTYTCVCIFSKDGSDSVEYQRLSPESLRSKGGTAEPLWSHEVSWESLDAGPWYPGVKSVLRVLFDRLRRCGPFLGDTEICDRVFQGLKTSLDPVYVLDFISEEGDLLRLQSKTLDREVVLERAIVKPLVKGREMKRFCPLPWRKVVLFPYEKTDMGVTLIPSGSFETQAKHAWQYLNDNKEALDHREDGKFKGAKWYQFGRSQALDVVSLPKLLTPDLVDRMQFSLDSSGDLAILGGAAGGYGLLPAKPEHAAPLLALLNSKLLEWMIRPPGLSSPFRGGWFSCEARFINLLPIRLPSDRKETEVLGSLATRAVEAYRRLWAARTDRDKSLVERQIEAIEAQIDNHVFKLYDVKPDERRAVETEISEARQAAGKVAQIETDDLDSDTDVDEEPE